MTQADVGIEYIVVVPLFAVVFTVVFNEGAK